MIDTSTSPTTPTGRARLGVMYDGAWFTHLWRWCEQQSPWQAAPAFAGIHGALRWYLYRAHGIPLEHVEVAAADYVLGRPTGREQRSAGREWDIVLRRAGVQRHDVPVINGHQQGAEVLLGQVMQDQTRALGLSHVAVITGDLSLIPVIEQLRATGIGVIVPTIQESFSQTGRLVTRPELLRAASHAPPWRELLTTALEPDYPLCYPFTHPAVGAVSRPAADGHRYGTVNRWNGADRYGFITDRGGQRWFAHRSVLPPRVQGLQPGQPVRFTGRPTPSRGHEYPMAATVRPFTATGPIDLLGRGGH